MSTTLAVLRQRALESIGDWVEVAVTTAIAADTSVISTNLNAFDGGADDYFNNWFCYIADENNAGVERQISNYATSGGVITVRGDNLTAETAGEKATVWVCRHSVLQIIDKAINRAIEEVYPSLHKSVDDLTLITGNVLPNSHFEDWTVTTHPDSYSMQDSNITATALTTAGLVRGGAKSMNVVTGAAGAGHHALITSNDYPRLLDLMGETVSFYCWAYPEVADDATIEIHTIKADGSTTQTLTSTTTCPAGAWTLLELEDQTINDDIVTIEFRFEIATASKYVYFDDALAFNGNLYEYLLPESLQNGHVDQVYMQVGGYSDIPAHDLHPKTWRDLRFNTISEGGNKYLSLENLTANKYRLRLIGTASLDALSAATDTIDLNASGRVDMLVAYASYLLYEMTESPVSSEDMARYERESSKRYAKYQRLLRRFRMLPPAGRLKV